MSTNYPVKTKYSVNFSDFCKNHYLKTFAKKYKEKAWIVTEEAIIASLELICNLTETGKLDHIKTCSYYSIYKFDFAVAGTKTSAKSSGNRIVLVANHELCEIEILIIYSKNEISSPNETQKWLKIVREHFPEYESIFSL